MIFTHNLQKLLEIIFSCKKNMQIFLKDKVKIRYHSNMRVKIFVVKQQRGFLIVAYLLAFDFNEPIPIFINEN